MTPLRVTLCAVLCLGFSAGGALSQSPTAVVIDMSTAGAQPGSFHRASERPVYTPPPQRYFPNETQAASAPWPDDQTGLTKGLGESQSLHVTTPFSADIGYGAYHKSLSLAENVGVSFAHDLFKAALSDWGNVITPLRVAGPAQPAPGRLIKGQAFVTAPVVRQLQGRLTAPLDRFAGALSGIKDLPVGTEMYGVELQLFGPKRAFYGAPVQGGATIWCAPTAGKSVAAWDAACFVPVKGVTASTSGFQLWRMRTDRFGFRFEDGDGVTRSLAVEQDSPANARPMTGSVRFVKWTGKGARVSFEIEADGVSTMLSEDDIPRQPDGSVLVQAFGGVFRLTPAGQDAQDSLAEMVRSPADKTPDMIAQSGAPFSPG